MVGAAAHQRRADDRQRALGAAVQVLELVEDDDDVAVEAARCRELRVQGLDVLRRASRPAPHRPLDDLDVEPDLLLEHGDLPARLALDAPLRMRQQRVVDAADERGDAEQRCRLTRTTVCGGASSPWERSSSRASWTVKVVLPVSRGPNSATFVWPLRISATSRANPSIPTILAGSSSGRLQMNGLTGGTSVAREGTGL